MSTRTRIFPLPELPRMCPAPEYQDWRANEPLAPVTLSDGTEAFAVTRYADVRTVLEDPAFSRAQYPGRGLYSRDPDSLPLARADPPQHTRRRRAIGKWFTPAAAERRRPELERIAAELAAAMRRAGPPADLVGAFARPFPLIVICEILGVPVGDRGRFAPWVSAMMSTPASGYTAAEVAVAHESMGTYFAGLIAARRAESAAGCERPDLLSDLITDPTLSGAEAAALGGGLLIAGHETTGNQLAAYVYLLLRRPALAARLRADPAALPDAVEELLRWTPLFSTGGVPHVATADVPLAGTVVRAGQVVVPVLDAADRDPEVFDRPDEILVDRGRNPHLAFGHGRHLCPGAHLARIELQVGLAALLREFPDLELAVPEEGLRWRRGMFVRGPDTLPVRWGATPAPRPPRDEEPT